MDFFVVDRLLKLFNLLSKNKDKIPQKQFLSLKSLKTLLLNCLLNDPHPVSPSSDLYDTLFYKANLLSYEHIKDALLYIYYTFPHSILLVLPNKSPKDNLSSKKITQSDKNKSNTTLLGVRLIDFSAFISKNLSSTFIPNSIPLNETLKNITITSISNLTKTTITNQISPDIQNKTNNNNLENVLENFLNYTPNGLQPNKDIEIFNSSSRARSSASLIQARKSFPLQPCIQYCPHVTLAKCTQIRKSFMNNNNNKNNTNNNNNNNKSNSTNSSTCNLLHFKHIIIPHCTEFSLGDCSYLDSCHKIGSCKFLHYEIIQPTKAQILSSMNLDVTLKKNLDKDSKSIQLEKNINNNLTPYNRMPWMDPVTSRPQMPPQWIRCDVRHIDFSILGKFSVVMADPAWSIHMSLPYGTCDDNELLSLNIETLQDNGIMLLWVTGRTLEVGRECLAKWGYECVDEIIWIKTNQIQRTICTGRTGHWLNHTKEHLLVGSKGDTSWCNRGLDTDVIVAPTRETSRKPSEIYEIVDRLVGKHARKLELFGRDHNLQPGWMTLGNQLATSHNIVESEFAEKYNKWRSLNPERF